MYDAPMSIVSRPEPCGVWSAGLILLSGVALGIALIVGWAYNGDKP